MRFRMLGPLELHDGSGWIGIGAAKARSLLAVLLVRAGSVVSMDRLVFELWGDRPPKTAVTQIHGSVMRLRRMLDDRDGRVLATVAPGYRVVLAGDDLDAQVFGLLADRGHRAARSGDAARAAELFRQALAQWRGPALSDVSQTPLAAAEANRLAEQRQLVLEARIDADLDCGRHGILVGELQQYADEHPLREQPWRQLMLALYRGGRQAEALRAYHRLRDNLVDELGTEPSADIQRLHQRLLAGDEGPLRARQPSAEIQPILQLPADVPDFTGRGAQLAVLVAVLTGGSADAPPPVAVVFGGPGVGKSTLALHAARTADDTFPDGQLYLDLAGTSDHPGEPAVLLAELLHAFGVTGTGIPDGLPARATLFRSLLSGRRMLLVLDDAAYADQVRPLLPPTGSCAVLVTSRRLLTELPGARHIELGVLPAADAAELFAGIVGRDRAAAEPDQAAAIVRRCGHLPLAIRIAAGKLVGRPAWSLRVLRERLDDESRRLSELRLGDLGVRASFDLSMRLLSADAVLAFRSLGLLGPLSLPGWVAGPLLDRAYADDILDELVDANLVQLAGMDLSGQARYRLHDLLRAYAVEGGARHITAAERRHALTRLLESWLELVTDAAGRLPPSPFGPVPGEPGDRLPDGLVRRLTTEPLRWFDAERVALLGMIRLAAEHGLDELAWRLATSTVPYYDHRSLYQDWEAAYRVALDAVVAADNKQGEAVLRRGLGSLHIYRDAYDDAAANLHRSREIFLDTGDKAGLASAIMGLVALHRCLGKSRAALDWAFQALELAVAIDDQHLEAHIKNSIGRLQLESGRGGDAQVWFDEALDLSRRLGDLHREAVVLREVSQLHAAENRLDQALACLDRAAAIFEGLDDERCVAYTLLKTGRVHAARGDRAAAAAVLRPAADIFARNGTPSEEAKCWQLLGELDVDARRHLTIAQDLWRSIGATERVAEVTALLERLPA